MTKKIFLLLLLLLFFVSCDTAETAGERISYETGLRGAFTEGTKNSFTNSKGFEIALDKAFAALGPVYFYSKSPFSSIEKCPAHAQADKGTILGEISRQFVVDLLSDSITDTGVTDGEAGTLRMSEVHVHPPKDPQLETGSDESQFTNLNGNSIYIEGTAEKDGDEYSFIVDMTISDEGTMRVIENITTNPEIELDDSGVYRIILSVLMDKWFINVDFSTLENDTDGKFFFSENDDSQAYSAFLSALRSHYSYTVTRSKK